MSIASSQALLDYSVASMQCSPYVAPAIYLGHLDSDIQSTAKVVQNFN